MTDYIGWVCPKCGAVWSPIVESCRCGGSDAPVPDLLRSNEERDREDAELWRLLVKLVETEQGIRLGRNGELLDLYRYEAIVSIPFDKVAFAKTLAGAVENLARKCGIE